MAKLYQTLDNFTPIGIRVVLSVFALSVCWLLLCLRANQLEFVNRRSITSEDFDQVIKYSAASQLTRSGSLDNGSLGYATIRRPLQIAGLVVTQDDHLIALWLNGRGDNMEARCVLVEATAWVDVFQFRRVRELDRENLGDIMQEFDMTRREGRQVVEFMERHRGCGGSRRD